MTREHHVPPDWFERLVGELPPLPPTAFSHFRAPAGVVPRRSAVLVLFGPGEAGGPEVLLTQRSESLRSHAGQIAFPGGRIDATDAGPEAAALREAVEETGLDPGGVKIRATAAELYVSVTNFLVTPVIGWWERPTPVAPVDPAEVARVINVPIVELLDPRNRFSTVHPSGFVSPGFEVADVFVWGFTAGVLDWLLSLTGLERPWDRHRRRAVPDRLLRDRTLAQELAGQLDERVPE